MSTFPSRALNFEQTFAIRTTAQVSGKERHRRQVVRLIFVMYGLLLLEGVLRKWLLPGFGQVLFFIRDPFLMGIYALVLHRGQTLSRSLLLFGGAVLAAGALVILSGQLVFSGIVPAYLALYGWRNYFLYIPVAFVIERYFRKEDLDRLVRSTLLLSIPLALLIAIQVSSPALSPINAGLGEDPAEGYTNVSSLLEGGIVRPSGTFTSALGMTAYTAAAVAMSIAMWMLPGRGTPVSKSLLAVCTAALVVCVALSGSRTAFLWSGLIVVVAIAGFLAVRPAMGFKSLGMAAIITVFGVTTMPAIFPETTHAFITRWTGADQAESAAYGRFGVFGRALSEFVSFRILLNGTPEFGYGLGSSGNAAWHLGIREKIIPFANDEEIGAAESDWGRNILELGPVLGCLMIAFRVAFTMRLFRTAISATQISGNPVPWMLFAFVGQLLMYGQITANGTLNGFAWLFTGFCLAAASIVTHSANSTSSLGTRTNLATG